MELIEVVSERMKALLEAYDYSQYMLFLKSGVPRSTISMILNCRVTDVRLSTLYNFCFQKHRAQRHVQSDDDQRNRKRDDQVS